MEDRLPIQYYGIIKELNRIGKWSFEIKKVVTSRECFETVRYGEVCREDGYIKIMHENEEVQVKLLCKQLSYMDTTGFGTHEHYSSYLCRLETESVYGIRTVNGKYIGPELAEFVMEVVGTDYMYSYRLGKVLWVFDAEKGKIVILPEGDK